MTERWPADDFNPPYSRHYWIHSKKLSHKDLHEGATSLLCSLKNQKRPPLEEGEIRELGRKIIDVFSKKGVSAIIAAHGEGKGLEACLQHVLTQKTDLELDVCVWNVDSSPKIRNTAGLFRGVKIIESLKGEKTGNALFRITASHKHPYLLLLSSDILMPSTTLNLLYRKTQEDGTIDILAPQTVWKKYFSFTSGGHRLSPKKLLAGRIPLLKKSRMKRRAGWTYGECLFIRREAVFYRECRKSRLKKRNIFLWTQTKNDRSLHHPPDILVYKRS